MTSARVDIDGRSLTEEFPRRLDSALEDDDINILGAPSGAEKHARRASYDSVAGPGQRSGHGGACGSSLLVRVAHEWWLRVSGDDQVDFSWSCRRR